MRLHLGSAGASIAIAAVVMALSNPATPADAAGKPQAKRETQARTHPLTTQPSQRKRSVETHDDVRANSQDPAGNYKAFPSWARAAFSNFPRD
jgi:hypothetical protein